MDDTDLMLSGLDSHESVVTEFTDLVLHLKKLRNRDNDTCYHPIIFPDKPQPIEKIAQHLHKLIIDIANNSCVQNLAHIATAASQASCVGDMLASLLNGNKMSSELSGGIYQLEQYLIQHFGQLIYKERFFTGLLSSSGSYNNFHSIILAREYCYQNNLASPTQQHIVLASENSHYSITKAMKLLGRNWSLQSIQTTPEGIIDLKQLAYYLHSYHNNPNCAIIAVVATAGTTISGTIDPIFSIRKLTNEYNIWLHIDAAFGGALCLSEQYQHLIKGIDSADSIVWNLHKWLFMSQSVSLLLTKHDLTTLFYEPIPYTFLGAERYDPGSLTIFGSARIVSIKVFLALQRIGRQQYVQYIDDSMQLQRNIKNWLADNTTLQFNQALGVPIVTIDLPFSSEQRAQAFIKNIIQLTQWQCSLAKSAKVFSIKYVIIKPGIDFDDLTKLFQCINHQLMPLSIEEP